jgi:hypothetical protein
MAVFMTRRRWLLLAVSAPVFAGAAWYLWPRHHVTVQDVEEQLRIRTPVGAPAGQVLAVLDSMKVEHSDASRGLITANFGRSSENFLVYGEVFGTFRLNAQGRLASYKVEEFFTGP